MRAARGLAEEVERTQLVYRGTCIQLLDKTVRLPDGRRARRDVVTYEGGAVCIVAITQDDGVVLVRQYRPAPEKITVEIPAGRKGYGESPLAAARRELREETGFTAATWKRGICFWPSPGFVDEKLTLYIASGLRQGNPEADADEFIEVFVVPLADALQQCLTGAIDDAKTLIGLLWYAASRATAIP